MTCIAWDGKTLAADKRSTANGIISSVTKIYRIDDVLVGGAGKLAFANAMIEWVRQGRKVDDYPASQRDRDDWQPFIVIESDGTVSDYGLTPFPIRLEQQHIAIGSGSDLAMAAMHLGKNAREAVDVACALSSHCGNGIDTLDLV